ncbi:hypothetical protein ACWEVD_24610 [Nocardia thailandica]
MSPATRVVPLLGWAFLALGLIRPFRNPALRVLFWIDVALSVVAHAAQIPAGRRAAAAHGIPPGRATALTMVFGATWWRTLGEGSR